MSDRTRTGDHLDHNQELYQLSYAHRAGPNVAVPSIARETPGPKCFRQDSNLRGGPEPDRRARRAIAAITWQRPVLRILGKCPMAPDG